VEIRAKKENRKLPPKTLLCPFSPSGGPPGAPAPRPSPAVASLPSPPLSFPPHVAQPPLLFFLHRPTEFPPPPPARGQAGLLSRPLAPPPLLGRCSATHSARHPSFFPAPPSPFPPARGSQAPLAHSLRAAQRSSQARRADGSVAMHSGDRFFNFRPRISRPRRENRPRPRYAVLIRPGNNSARVPNISFFSLDRTVPHLETAPCRSSPDLLHLHPILAGVIIFLRLLYPPLLSLFLAESVFFRSSLRACGVLARGDLRSRGLAWRPEFIGVARPHLPSRPMAPFVAYPRRVASPPVACS
jgi:hypothetical protein